MRALPRIAYITPNALIPPNRGGRIRAHHLWRALSSFGNVTPIIVGENVHPELRDITRNAGAVYLPRRPYRLPRSTAPLEREALLALPGLWEMSPDIPAPPAVWNSLGTSDALVRHCLNPGRIERIIRLVRRIRPDLVVLCDTSMALLAAHVRALGVKVVAGPHNFDSDLYRSMATSAPNEYLRRWSEMAAQAFGAAERLMAPHVDQLWVCSRADADRFAAHHVPPDGIEIIPNVFDIGQPLPPPMDGANLLFVGQANYYPNEDAICRLFTISRKLDDLGIVHRMQIVGRTTDRIRSLASGLASVEIVGEVQSVTPYLENANLVPIALTLGGGTRLKILEAMASARTVLSTPIGIEGIEVENGVHAIVEPDLDAFPERIRQLLFDRVGASRLAEAGWAFVREHYSHEALVSRIGNALHRLGLHDAQSNGKSFARNVGTEVVKEMVSFNPFTRLLTWTLLLRMASSAEVVAAELGAEDRSELSNAFVTVKKRPHSLIGLEGSAMLPADIGPDQLVLDVFAWGRHVLRHKLSSEIPLETSGMLTLEATDGGVQTTCWTTGEGAFISSPNEPVLTAPASLPGVQLLTARFPTLLGPLTFGTADGLGPTLPNPAVWLGPYRPSTARLSKLRDKHRGETAWLVGNGPSVRIEDLDRLQDQLTFCFNRFHLAHDKTRLRATYTATGDKQMIEDFGQQIVDESGGTVFVAHEHAPDLLGDYIWLRQVNTFPPLFSKVPDLVVSPGGSTPFVAMQLLYFMGVRKFYFYGADFSFRFGKSQIGADAFRSATGEGNHFIANYRSNRPWCPPSLRDIGAAFLAARLVIEAEGGFIRNVTHGGLLEIFEREDFDRALANS
ncbi:MAG: glycosyltransferase [Rhodospirillales bacterium]|nr:glycosyltransferase [Rhodospirillales bacterium]MBN8925114.1 glycosyltransferase [Rhodospirillales bacterium]